LSNNAATQFGLQLSGPEFSGDLTMKTGRCCKKPCSCSGVINEQRTHAFMQAGRHTPVWRRVDMASLGRLHCWLTHIHVASCRVCRRRRAAAAAAVSDMSATIVHTCPRHTRQYSASWHTARCL